jgi:hypothetical protein
MRRIAWLIVVLPLALAPAAFASKLDSTLARTLAVHRGHAKATVGGLRIDGPPVRNGKVLVDVYVNGSARAAAPRLRDLGMRVVAISGRLPERGVEGWLPLDRVDAAARMSSTRAIAGVQPAMTDTGSVLSQGDAAHHGPQARAFGVTGAGVPVGIMSDSINQVGGGVASSQASGNLPSVQIIQDGGGGSDEGRAMAEIVYDTAPGIPKIIFATANGGAINRAANIDALVANGAKVIADDTFFLTEPFFQDGSVAQAVDRAKANGTAYFASAGNRARQSWEGNYTPASDPTKNDFNPGGTEDTVQTVVAIPDGGTLQLVLQWAQPVGAVTTNLDLDLYQEPNETAPLVSSSSNNITTGLPIENVQVSNNTGSAKTVAIGIRRVAGTGTPLMKWIAFTNFGTFTTIEHDTASQAINPDAASARGSLAVAAVDEADPGHDTAEDFSSRGPTVTRRFDASGNPVTDNRQKPDIAGADGVSTSVPGFAPFFGTSAATPSAAGVGALLRSAYPTMTVDQLYAAMRSGAGAVDCTASGLPDADCGFGFVFADQKMFGLDTTGPTETPVLSPAAPDGTNGWFRQNVSLSWAVSDDRSPSSAGADCGPAVVTTDTVATFSCTGTSSGGTTTQPVTIKRDATPPTAPAITGITTGTFNAKRLPGAGSVRCSATDPTSGVDSCVISSFSRRPGRHTLTATATNDAGLQSRSTLAYTVRPFVVRALRVPARISLAALRGNGLPVKFTARAKGTITISLKRGSKRVAGLRKRFGRGSHTFRLKGNRTGRLTLVVKATSANASTVTFTRHLRVR